jgi:hypothetical protein
MSGTLATVNTAYEKGFEALGGAMARRPALSLALVVLATLGMSVGLIGVKIDVDVLESLIPYGSRFRQEVAHHHPALVFDCNHLTPPLARVFNVCVQDAFETEQFGAGFSRTEYVSAFPRSGDNVITPQNLAEWSALHQSLETISFTYDGVAYTR